MAVKRYVTEFANDLLKSLHYALQNDPENEGAKKCISAISRIHLDADLGFITNYEAVKEITKAYEEFRN